MNGNGEKLGKIIPINREELALDAKEQEADRALGAAIRETSTAPDLYQQQLKSSTAIKQAVADTQSVALEDLTLLDQNLTKIGDRVAFEAVDKEGQTYTVTADFADGEFTNYHVHKI